MQSRRVLMSVFLPLSIAMCATPAIAGWRFAKWGMSPEEVIAASGGKAAETSNKEKAEHSPSLKPDPEDALLKMDYNPGDFRFTVFFCFDRKTQRLASVYLNLRNSEAGGKMLEAMRKTYGEPTSQGTTATESFAEWRTKEDLVTWFRIGEASFQAIYQRPKASDASKP